MDWESLYCPKRRCQYYGRLFFKDKWLRMAVVMARNKLYAGRAERTYLSGMVRPT